MNSFRVLVFLFCVWSGMNPSYAADGPLVIAHRGASGYLPEHTLAAKAFAYAQGAGAIEQDVVLTKDQVPIILHDVTLESVTDVEEKFANRKRDDGHYYAFDFTLKEIRQLNVNERRDHKTGQAAYPKRFPIGKSRFAVPTLAEEIELIQGLNHSTGRNVLIYPELKKPAWHRAQGADLTARVLEVLSAYGYKKRESLIYVQCFESEELQRLRNEFHCQLKLIYLVSDKQWDSAVNRAGNSAEQEFQHIATYADGVGPSLSLILKGVAADGKPELTSFVAQAHAARLQVHPYTMRVDALPAGVDSFDQLMQIFVQDAKVDGMFTDFPDRSLEYIHSR
ncbi:MAG: glycerophosphodiester phosphodiesterase [Planctomycetaceae bacterium]|nr:glycerophosphodiester phosphodiesterase [Planctomycetaceae bacterium]